MTVSSGPGDAAVPVVAGHREVGAEPPEKAGFKSDLASSGSRLGRAGSRDRSLAAEGTLVERGIDGHARRVQRAARRSAVPDVVGKHRDAATESLNTAGLRPTFAERETADEDPGTVLEKTPKAGSKAPKDSRSSSSSPRRRPTSRCRTSRPTPSTTR